MFAQKGLSSMVTIILGEQVLMNNLEKLENTCCPCCGKKRLRLKETGDWWPEFPEYYVGCDECDWDYYESKCTDCGDALVMFFYYIEGRK